jgi:hypothetical protein
VPPRPIEVRRWLAFHARQTGRKVILMEEETTLPDELLTSKFHRLLLKQDVDEVAIYWPAGCNRSGLDVEIGFLLSLIDRNQIDPAGVVLVVQDGLVALNGNNLTFLEPGKRTQYFLDLYRFQCPS